jgi:hypothetical protein
MTADASALEFDDSRRFLHRVFMDEPVGVAATIADVPVCPTCLRAFTATKYGPPICDDCWHEHIARSGAGGKRYVTPHGDRKHYTPLCPHLRGSTYRMTSDEACVYGRRQPCGSCGPGGRIKQARGGNGDATSRAVAEGER